MSSYEDPDDITGLGRYGADPSAIRNIYKKKIKVVQTAASSSSEEEEESSSSSSSDEAAEHGGVQTSSDAEVQDRTSAAKSLRARITIQAKNATAQALTLGIYGNNRNITGELEKLKSEIRSAANREVEDIDDSDSSEPPQPRIVPTKRSIVETLDESELEEDDDDSSEQSENIQQEHVAESEEEEEEEFFIKFASDKSTKISVNPKSPLQNAFDKFCSLPGNQNRRFVFKFDGELIRGTQTAESLGLESGDQIDVKVK